MKRCSKLTKYGRCSQPTEDNLCSAHERWALEGRTPDAYYERKLVEGHTSSTWDYMTDAEADALLNGRYRGDGRRLDQYVSADPIGWRSG